MPVHRGRVAFGRKDVKSTLRFLLLAPAALLAAALVWLLAGGRGDARAPGGPAPGAVNGAVSAAVTEWPRAIPSARGGTVTLAAPPRRVVLGNASAADMVTALIAPDRLAALPEQAFAYSKLADDPGAFADLPRFARFEAEVVLAYEPDLVLVDPWAAIETVARLEELGVPVLALPQVTSLEDVRASLATLGDALGAEERAAEILADLDARVAALAAGAPRRAGRTALSYVNSGAGGWTAGAGTTSDAVIRLAGLQNAAALAGRRDHVRTSFEELHAMDPDFLIVGDYRPGEPHGATTAFLRREPALADLRAVRADRILELPERLYSASSQEIVTAAEVLAAAVDRRLSELGER